MFKIKVRSHFSAAHNLRHYRGKCEQLHGHNWKVEVSVEAGKLDKQGLVFDFQQLKSITRAALKKLDHRFLNEIPYFKKKNPTSEQLAEYIYKDIAGRIKNKPFKLKAVSVWETETSCATYSRD